MLGVLHRTAHHNKILEKYPLLEVFVEIQILLIDAHTWQVNSIGGLHVQEFSTNLQAHYIINIIRNLYLPSCFIEIVSPRHLISQEITVI